MKCLGVVGGTNAGLALEGVTERPVATEWGEVSVEQGLLAGREICFVRRHGAGHERLSSAVDHRANIAALAECDCDAIVATTVCGIVDPAQPLARAIVFDDLFFPDNRLPDGSPCTFFARPGQQGRGHYIFGSPFSPTLRAACLAAAASGELKVRDGGTYAYVLGPRFNSRTEIAWLASVGATAVSQTAGPEAVLAGELEIPYALVGFGVDYANGVQHEPTPVEELDANIGASGAAFSAIVAGVAGRLAETPFDTGFVYRF